MQQGDLLASRFKQGKLALPAQVIRKLHAKKNQTFASQVALDSWLETQGFDPVIQEKISQSVPPTKRVADDVVLALHLETESRSGQLHCLASHLGEHLLPLLASTGEVFLQLAVIVYFLSSSNQEKSSGIRN